MILLSILPTSGLVLDLIFHLVSTKTPLPLIAMYTNRSEYADVIAYPLLLILSNALSNPGDVSDFL